MSLQNEGFEDWNYGTSFTNPVDGTQLADNWYYTSNLGPTTVTRSTSKRSGNYALKISSPNGNGTGYIYQDVSDVAQRGQTVTISAWVKQPDLDSGGTFSIAIGSDNNNFVSESVINPGLTYVQISVSMYIDVEETFRVYLSSSAGFSDLIVDDITMELSFPLNLSLSDAIANEEEIVPFLGVKRVTDQLRIQDWLRKRKRHPRKIWSN